MTRKQPQKGRGEAQGPRVLKGHRQRGKRFIPPFLDYLNLRGISWLDELLPELIWIGLMNSKFGLKRGAELCVEVARAASACTTDSEGAYAFVSEYHRLQEAEQECAKRRLADSRALDPVIDGLRVLATHYSKCPLAFLWSGETHEVQDDVNLDTLKELIRELADRRGKAATFVQATAVYIYFLNDKLKVASTTALADFTAIEAYPETESSIRVASSIRAVLNGFMEPLGLSDEWRNYFWNRGRKLGPCE